MINKEISQLSEVQNVIYPIYPPLLGETWVVYNSSSEKFETIQLVKQEENNYGI